jgi:hypothetical protein
MNEYTVKEAPYYSLVCSCGIRITGNSEKGLVSLVKRHIESGAIHMQWVKFNNITDSIEWERMFNA